MDFYHACHAALLAGNCLVMNHDGSVEHLDPHRRTSRLVIASVPSGETRDPLTASRTAAMFMRREKIRGQERSRE